MLRRLTSTAATWATVPLRLALGITFIAHGMQKVFGAWSGPGLARFASFPSPFPFMRPAWLWMGAAAIAELVGGILVLLGLLTRVGAFLITCVMLTAMIGVHWRNGFFFTPTSMGIEFTLGLLAIALALLIAGGGKASVDRMIGGRR
ncbi:MAG TPA: DoxX family protein [Terriglobales bacterium]|nr:DoxX family protein [Terriglobales bacterium]